MTAPNEDDLYSTLGVAKDATADQIKTAYRKLARKFHPDVNPDDAAAEDQFKKVSAAFDVLGDVEKRKIYDEFGAAGLESGFDPDQARAYREWQTRSRASSGFGGAGFSRGGFGGIDLNDLFGDLGGAGAARPRAGADVDASITVSLRDAVLGSEREVGFARPTTCDECHGSGVAAATGPKSCRECGGRGRIEIARGPMTYETFCQRCGGSGHEPGPPCPKCGGDGTTQKNVRLKVKIPAGIGDGQKIRLAGQGLPGPAGGPPGALFLKVSIAPHPHLKRAGRDLSMDLPVTIREAMFGAKVEVPTLQGPISLSVPPGSQSGSRLRVRGRGVPAFDGGKAGDLFVVLQVQVPPSDQAEDTAREAAESLDALYPGDIRAGLEV